MYRTAKLIIVLCIFIIMHGGEMLSTCVHDVR
jgi:hypothetical protein